MSDPHEFTVDGTKFTVSPLKLKPSLRGERLVAEALFPTIVIASRLSDASVSPADVRDALVGFDGLEALVDLFAPVCQVDWDGGQGNMSTVPLAGFLEQVFQRRNAALLAWLLECVEYQYADFFDGSGLELVVARVSRLASQIG